MKIFKGSVAASAFLIATMVYAVQSVPAETAADLVRETLRRQSAAERSICTGVRGTISAGTDAALVVRTAIELGFNSCQVIRCALEGPAANDRRALCEKVIRGAVAAGVKADVIARCSAAACGAAAVAAILASTLLEPNYCYFSPQPLLAPDPLPPPEAVIERRYPPPQASPFTF